MFSDPLDILKKKLVNLQSQARETKNKLLIKLVNHEIITEEEEHWLDQDTNLIEKKQIIEELKKVSNYKQELEKLDKIKKKVIVHFSAATRNKVISNQQKSKFLNEFYRNLLKT